MSTRIQAGPALSFSEPFGLYGSKDGDPQTVILEVNVSQLIDHHTYHDAPSSVDVYLSKDDLIELRSIISKLVEKMP